MQKEKHFFRRFQKAVLLTFFALLSSSVLFAQIQVKGTITDAARNPLIGVNVIEKGTTNGTVTDLDGSFALRVQSSNSLLALSYIGFQSQEILVGDQTQFSIVLVEDTRSLDELVVVGYGTQAKKDITGSVAVVKAEDL